MRVKLEDVSREIFAGGDVPKNKFSLTQTEEFNIPIYANAEKDEGLYGYTNKARVYDKCVTVAARGTVGYCAKRCSPFLPVVGLITVIPNETIITTDYLYYALKHIRISGSGTSIPQLTVPDIKKYSFELASLERQNEIVRQFKTVEIIINTLKKQLTALDTLIKARFVEMFVGKYKSIKVGEILKTTSGGTPKSGTPEYYDGGKSRG